MLQMSTRQAAVTARGSPGPPRAYGRPVPALPLIAERVSVTPCACGGGCRRCATGEAVHDAASPIMTVDPQVKQGEGQGEGAVGSATGTTAATGQGAATRCQVQSFTKKISAWNRQWPNGSGDYVLQLPVSFDLELAAGTSRAD